MTFAVLLARSSVDAGFYVAAAVALAILAASTGMLSTLLCSAWRSGATRRIVLALVVAMLLGAGTASAAIYCCCDPWWATYFWICIEP